MSRRGSFEFTVQQIKGAYHIVGEPDGPSKDAGWERVVSQAYNSRREAESNLGATAKVVVDGMNAILGNNASLVKQ
jgi:hypothetical protein